MGGAAHMTKIAEGSAGPDVITRLRQAEADLAAIRRELDHSYQLATLGTLTAGIAHEINNILTPVLAYAQLARANPRDSELSAKALDRAIAGVESAARINEAVLGDARNDDGESRADVAEVVKATLACLARDPARDGVDLCLEIEPRTLVAIRPLARQQVLLNLVLNALTAMHGRRGVQGELRIRAVRRDDGTTKITVADNGPGVPKELEQRIFEPFVSGHPRKPGTESAGVHGGSGLGLAICKRLIENGAGTIALERQVASGMGATFAIILRSAA